MHLVKHSAPISHKLLLIAPNFLLFKEEIERAVLRKKKSVYSSALYRKKSRKIKSAHKALNVKYGNSAGSNVLGKRNPCWPPTLLTRSSKLPPGQKIDVHI